MLFKTKNTSTNNFSTILALNFSRILINIYPMLPSHIKPITRRIVSRCHKFNNSRINSNQPCNQSKHFITGYKLDFSTHYKKITANNPSSILLSMTGYKLTSYNPLLLRKDSIKTVTQHSKLQLTTQIHSSQVTTQITVKLQ
jgi:hypothetical protein